MSFIDALAGVAEQVAIKLLPGRKEQYVQEMQQLEGDYQTALNEGRDTDAATIRKRLVKVRQLLGFTGKDL